MANSIEALHRDDGELRTRQWAECADGAAERHDHLRSVFANALAEQAPLLHQLSLATGREEIDALLQRFDSIYNELLETLDRDPNFDRSQFPQSAVDFTASDKRALEHSIAAFVGDMPDLLESARAVAENLARIQETIPQTNRAKNVQGLHPAFEALKIVDNVDSMHEKTLENLYQKSKERNRQLSALHAHLAALYENGETLSTEEFRTRYQQMQHLVAELLVDFPEIDEYISLPDLNDDFEISEKDIQHFAQNLEVLKMHLQNDMPQISNDIQKEVQLYTMVVDILKNILKMDSDQKEAVIRRSAQ